MENIINQIINIEDRAQEIMRDADKLKNSLNADIIKQVEDIRADVEESVAKKYDSISKTESEYADKKIEDIKKQYSHASHMLDEIYKEKENEWVESIYKAVLGIK